jgi:hypothetical protein
MINSIKHLFPNADPLVDFELRDNSDGKGPYIARWDTVKLGTQPTAQQLADVSLAAGLAHSKIVQLSAVRQSCATAYVSGFPSAALGAYTYPSKPYDQTNLIGAVASGEAVDFWTCDAAGTWLRRTHTAVQIKQVLSDGKAAYQGYSAKLVKLTADINTATTVIAVNAVVW